jgi:hypothetical protein
MVLLRDDPPPCWIISWEVRLLEPCTSLCPHALAQLRSWLPSSFILRYVEGCTGLRALWSRFSRQVLFFLGYRKDFHKELNNSVGVEIAKFRKVQGDKARAAKKDL